MIGTHFILDLFDIKDEIFSNNLSKSNYHLFDNYIRASLIKNKMTILNDQVHQFGNLEGAFTSLYLLSESHLSIHTWPENNFIAVDIFTCGDCKTKNIVDDIISYLKPGKHIVKNISRGSEPIIKSQ
uniref:S-adenosylmethionine decarboxylase n=1 Tax=viral metagenome TaxID=1070528 RepID=A0A6C0DTJ9_9ZZZZ